MKNSNGRVGEEVVSDAQDDTLKNWPSFATGVYGLMKKWFYELLKAITNIISLCPTITRLLMKNFFLILQQWQTKINTTPLDNQIHKIKKLIFTMGLSTKSRVPYCKHDSSDLCLAFFVQWSVFSLNLKMLKSLLKVHQM